MLADVRCLFDRLFVLFYWICFCGVASLGLFGPVFGCLRYLFVIWVYKHLVCLLCILCDSVCGFVSGFMIS